jgi:thiol-disulfide isomerase/thioredoxin
LNYLDNIFYIQNGAILTVEINIDKMKGIKFLPTFFIACIVCTGNIFGQNGYHINLTINGLRDTTVILGHYMASQALYPDDTVKLDRNGKGVFKGNSTLRQGLYFLYLPNGHPIDLIIGTDQKFSVFSDTVDFYKNLETKGSADNEIYLNYIREMSKMNAEMKEYSANLADTSSETDREKIRENINILIEKRINNINDIVKENPELMVSAFLKGTLEINVPDSIKDDQTASYHYTKEHYFDNFNLSDPRLFYTPLYDSKIKNYIDKMVLQAPDSLIKEIDFIISKVLNDSLLFKHVVTSLFSKYHKSEMMGMDALVVHIGEKYLLPKSWWLSEKSKKEIGEWVNKTEPILIGKTAPDFSLLEIPSEHFKQAADDTTLKRYPHVGKKYNIHSLETDFIVLFFWSPSCSHCKKEVPKMYEAYKKDLKGKNVKVLAINTLSSEDGKEKWVDFVNKHQLYEWPNAWYPYDFKYREDYDLRTTPQIFVLNKDKEIIGKKIGGEQVVGLIEAYEKVYSSSE